MQAIQKDQKHELLRSLKESKNAITTNGSSSNRKFNEAEFFERMKQFEESRSKTNLALRIRHEQEQLKEVIPDARPFLSKFLSLSGLYFSQCTFIPFMQCSHEEKRLNKQQRPTSSLNYKRSASPSYAALHNGRCRSAASSRNTTPLKNADPTGNLSLKFERVSQLLDTSVASATSDKRTACSKISMDLLFANTH
jgi:hypothetical protein